MLSLRVWLAVAYLVSASLPALIPFALLLDYLDQYILDLYWGDWLTLLFATSLIPCVAVSYLRNLRSEMNVIAQGVKLIQPKIGPDIEAYLRTCGVSRTKLHVLPVEAMNAFAWRGPFHQAIVLTSGLLNTMNRQELLFILGHEASHLRHNDALAPRMWWAFSRMEWQARARLVWLIYKVMGRWPALLLAKLLSSWSRLILFLILPIDRWECRRIEMRADREGAKLAGAVPGISSLRKLDSGRIEPKRWLSSHPTIDRRISNLRKAYTG